MIKIFFSSVLLLGPISNKCPETIIEIIEDDKGLTWTEEDDKVILEAQSGCIQHYGKDSCLVRLIKSGEKSYRAVCRKYNN